MNLFSICYYHDVSAMIRSEHVYVLQLQKPASCMSLLLVLWRLTERLGRRSFLRCATRFDLRLYLVQSWAVNRPAHFVMVKTRIFYRVFARLQPPAAHIKVTQLA
jgi:hypothetical protein